ncbi:uncharacterized protein [Henckelia pumila]|uniref:uncharacterized protein n=1 Tax=Henckelia pumila TaxID=405737 RepID=UPI003C6DC53A
MRGFNKPLKQRHVQGVLKKYNLSILGLLEVKVNVNLVDRMMDTKFSAMSFMHNFHMCTNSRILVMWESKAVRLDVLGMSDQVIHVSVVCLHSQRVFLASFIYGRNSVVAWRPLWDFLINHGENISLPWILLGDFNCVRYPHEKMGGNPIVPKDMADLRNCINRLELSDVNHVGFYYTWFSLAVSSKLDRVMVNHHWSESNLDVFADFVAPGEKKNSFLKRSACFSPKRPNVSISNIVTDAPNSSMVEEARWEVLIRDVSVEEVKSALFNIEDDKAPGPDGFGAAFFKKAWSIVDGDVIAAVLEFFRSVFYKIIAKFLTNRLVDVIEPLISQAQAAFVPGRSIVENIHMAQEMLKH